MSRSPTVTITAQPGPQTAVLQSAADICIFGGAAGCGKTFVLILEALRHVGRVAKFCRRILSPHDPADHQPGGLMGPDTFYPQLGGTPHVGVHEWRWPNGSKIKFSHLQFQTTVHDWQGAEIGHQNLSSCLRAQQHGDKECVFLVVLAHLTTAPRATLVVDALAQPRSRSAGPARSNSLEQRRLAFG